MDGNSYAEFEGGVEGLFLLIDNTFLLYKQWSTQGTITSRSLNKIDVNDQWVLWDFRPLVVPCCTWVLQPRAFKFSKSRRGFERCLRYTASKTYGV